MGWYASASVSEFQRVRAQREAACGNTTVIATFSSFCMFSKLFLIVDACTKFEFSSFSLSGDIRNTNIKN